MYLFILIPFAVQTILIAIDECYFHLKRGLPKWERIGHPIDTFSVLLCSLFVQFIPYSDSALKWYIGLCILSCLLITKDEFVHKHHSPASEQWLHAMLFLNHPIMLTCIGFIWPIIHHCPVPEWLSSWLTYPHILSFILLMQTMIIFSFMIYQIIYWNFIWKEETRA